MAIRTAQLDVGMTATPISHAVTIADPSGEANVVINNVGAVNIYVGDDTVSPTTGYRVAPGEKLSLPLVTSGSNEVNEVYAVGDADTIIHALWQGV